MSSNRKLYALYDKNDNLVMCGSCYEVADYLGTTVNNIHSRLSHDKERRKAGKRKYRHQNGYEIYDMGYEDETIL